MAEAAISVVIPAYNASRFLGETLESALSQTLPVEVVVVDDGSTDGTPVVVGAFGERVRYIRQENAGQAVARNVGAAAAQGSMLAFLDADDVWERDKLEKQRRQLEADPSLGMVHCSVREIDARGGLLDVRQARLRGLAFRRILLGEPCGGVCGSTMLIRRSVFQELGGFDAGLPPCEDTDLFFRVAVRYPIDYVDEPLVRYRQHATAAHRDLQRMTRAWRRFYAKALAMPEVVALGLSFRRRCEARLYYLLAGEHAASHRWFNAVRFGLRGAAAAPLQFVRLAARRRKISRDPS